MCWPDRRCRPVLGTVRGMQLVWPADPDVPRRARHGRPTAQRSLLCYFSLPGRRLPQRWLADRLPQAQEQSPQEVATPHRRRRTAGVAHPSATWSGSISSARPSCNET